MHPCGFYNKNTLFLTISAIYPVDARVSFDIRLCSSGAENECTGICHGRTETAYRETNPVCMYSIQKQRGLG